MRQAPKRSAQSAGLILYRYREGRLEVLLVHPGGPFWQKRDDGAWSIPKGEIAENEVGIDVAGREFQEELGVAAPDGEPISLGAVRQPREDSLYSAISFPFGKMNDLHDLFRSK